MTTFTVRSNAELTDILSRIDELGGGTIALEASGGPYQISARDLGSAGGPVTITAADPSAPPVVDSVDLRDSSHVTISNLHIQGKEAGNPQSVYVSGSDNITLTGNTMTGVAEEFLSKTNGATHANSAMLLRDSTNLTVSDNTISNFSTAIGVLEVDGMVIANNDISQLQGDGIQGAGFRNVDIIDNHFHNFLGSTQSINHSDMIQIWGKNAKSVTENVLISGNLLDAGDGALSQSIFIRNEDFGLGNDPENGYFKNIVIRENVIHNSAPHGIAVGHTDGLVIQSNTLLKSEAAYLFHDDGSEIFPTEPRYHVTDSLNVVGTDNIGTAYLGQITEAGNTVLVYDNTMDPMYVNNHIVNLSGQGDTGLGDLQIRTDSPLWGTAGAPMSSLSGEGLSDLGPIIATTKLTENALARELDASASALPEGASVAWHFADGSVIQGTTITHIFETSGLHDVTLVITQADGTSASTTRRIEIDDPYLFAFDFANGAEDITTRGIEAQVTGSDAQAFVDTAEDKGFYLNPNTALSLGRENTQLFGREAFNIDLRFKQTDAMKDGGLLGMHTVFKLDIENDGALSFWLRTSDGDFKITTEAGVMNTTDWQDIGVRYDGVAGTLTLMVDGVTMASGAATGATTGPLSWGVQLGRPWGDDATGVFESVSMSLPHDATPTPTPTTIDEGVTVIKEPDGHVIMLGGAVGMSFEDVDENAEVAAPPLEETPQPEPEAQPNVLLDVDFSDGGKDASSYNSQIKDDTAGAGFTTGKDGDGFQLGTDARFNIDNSSAQLFGLDAFNIAFDLRKDTADAHGGLLNQHTIMDLAVRTDGGFTLSLTTDEGSVNLRTDAGLLSDTDWHKINLVYDGDKGQVELLMDGNSLASAALTGRTADAKYWDFVVGDPWGDGLPAVVDNLKITLPDPAPEVAGVYAEAPGIEDAMPDIPEPAAEPAPVADAPAATPDPEPAPAPQDPHIHSLLDVDFSDGGADTSGYDSQINDRTNGAGFTDGKEGDGFQIGGNTTFRIDNSATQLFGLETFDIGFDFRRDENGGDGGLLNQQKVLDLNMRADGGLRLKLITDEGTVRMRTEAGVLDDTDWHRINVTYDSDKGVAQILVDGEVMASKSHSGRTADAHKRDFIIGDPWHDSAAGVIDNLQVTRPATAEEIALATASATASALSPLFADLADAEDAENAPMAGFETASSFEQAWAQGQIDAMSDNGLVLDPLLQV
ncbi:LamG-like jellyroll fold domain-containing protein [uncultured Sulfitobacter sp.]|uniref:LamG-like jellyroll fold domain-containing protein n=1 Tax=uncultured Sulfitobacter sp. TaxID=191468 RepID=UPI00262A4DDA|nr:LamG-like jellyroll fold domain-containing protein [uncultured Sulfitobacter sp.]